MEFDKLWGHTCLINFLSFFFFFFMILTHARKYHFSYFIIFLKTEKKKRRKRRRPLTLAWIQKLIQQVFFFKLDRNTATTRLDSLIPADN